MIICCLFNCLFVYLFICLFVYLFICLFVYLFVYLFIYLFAKLCQDIFFAKLCQNIFFAKLCQNIFFAKVCQTQKPFVLPMQIFLMLFFMSKFELLGKSSTFFQRAFAIPGRPAVLTKARFVCVSGRLLFDAPWEP